MIDYWLRKKERLRVDLDHVKRHIAQADPEDIPRLKELKTRLSDELAVCYEAVEKLEIPRQA